MRFTPRFYVGAILFLAVVVLGFLGPLVFSGHHPGQVVGGLYDPPTGSTWLGTDNLGHDVFANLMYGARTSLIIGLVAGAGATFIGVVLGAAAGYKGGFLDETLMGFTNVMLAIPVIVVLILVSDALPSRGTLILALIIGATSWPWTARAVRAQTASVRTREHIDVARLSGARTISIIAWDVLPYLMSYIAMAFVLQVSSAVLAEAGLSLLGLGPSTGVSLGIMLHWSLAWESIRTGAWWAFVPPTVLLTLIAFSLLMLQSSLDEVFNPRLRRGKARRVTAFIAGPESGGGSSVADSVAIGPTGMASPDTTAEQVVSDR
jgi:peptide/nickel transport system permease protein